MTCNRSLAVSFILATLFAQNAFASTTLGAVGDGKPSIAYLANTGEIIVQPDREPIGLFDIKSASGIFTRDAIFPPFGLGLDFDTAEQKSWASFAKDAFLTDFSLGTIAPAGLTQQYLLNDLTTKVTGGFGTAGREADLVYFGPGQNPPKGADVRVHFPTAGPGAVFTHQFAATDAEDPATALTWSNLQFTVDGPGAPNLQPRLSPSGQFIWDTTGSRRGVYTATTIVTDTSGLADMTVLTINTTPEPTTTTLLGIVMLFVLAHRSR